MKDRICLVTGANSGIGLATAAGLARQGARVVLACRNPERGEAARREIAETTGNRNVDLLIADLSSQRDVRRLAEQVRERYGRLHVLVNNAGGLFPKRQTSPDGFEMTLAVNYLSPFLLTHLLLEELEKGGRARVVNVASEVQAKRLDPEDLPNPAAYGSFQAYGQAKLAVVLMTYYLAVRVRERGITVNALHPGVVYTPQASRVAPAFARPLMKLFMASPEKGARTSLYLASSPEAESLTGRYFKDGKPKRSVPVSYDEELQRRLYERSLEWTGLS